jgi:hypothetical protein
MIGVDSIEPNTPPLEIEKVPPVRSSSDSLPSCAFLPNSAIFFSIAGERQLVRVAQDRHHQPARAADRDADVEVAVVDDVGAVHRRVHHRILLQRVHHRLDEEGHEAELDAVLLFEAVLVILAQRHHRRHVHFVEGGEDRRRGLRLHQALGTRARRRDMGTRCSGLPASSLSELTGAGGCCRAVF